jgi:hypothetical protein
MQIPLHEQPPITVSPSQTGEIVSLPVLYITKAAAILANVSLYGKRVIEQSLPPSFIFQMWLVAGRSIYSRTCQRTGSLCVRGSLSTNGLDGATENGTEAKSDHYGNLADLHIFRHGNILSMM